MNEVVLGRLLTFMLLNGLLGAVPLHVGRGHLGLTANLKRVFSLFIPPSVNDARCSRLVEPWTPDKYRFPELMRAC